MMIYQLAAYTIIDWHLKTAQLPYTIIDWRLKTAQLPYTIIDWSLKTAQLSYQNSEYKNAISLFYAKFLKLLAYSMLNF